MSLHMYINVYNNIHYDVLTDVYVPGEFRNPDTSANAVSLEQYDAEYIRQNAYFETRPPIGSRQQLWHMYPQLLGDIDEFKMLK